MIGLDVFSREQLSGILVCAVECDSALGVGDPSSRFTIKGWTSGVAAAMDRMISQLDDDWTIASQAKSKSLQHWKGSLFLDDGQHTTALPVEITPSAAVIGGFPISLHGKNGRRRAVRAMAEWIASQAL